MTRKTLVELLLGMFVVTLVLSNVLLASQVVALREQIPFMVSRASALAQERTEPTDTPIPSIDSLLADVWAASQSVATTTKIKISSITPSVGAGPVNSKAMIKGIGFTTTNNTVVFGYHRIPGLKSKGGVIEFTVPSYLVYSCASSSEPCPTHNVRAVMPGTYPVYVSNSRGTSKPAVFIVTNGPSPSIAP